MVSRSRGFELRELARELARGDGALRAHRKVDGAFLGAMRATIDGCSGHPRGGLAAALRLTGSKAPVTYDLGLGEGGVPGQIEAARRLPPEGMRGGWTVCVTLDAWPPRRVVVETFHDGRRQGAGASSPAAIQVLGGEISEQFWIAGCDVTQAVTHPASRLSDAASWSGELGVLAMAGHDRLLEVVAAAEEQGVAVAVHAASLSGAVFYSPGGGEAYRMLSTTDFKKVRAGTAETPDGLLSIQGSARGENWKAVRTVGGVLHGDTAELPAVCGSRAVLGRTEVSEASITHGVRVAPPGPVPHPR